MNSKRKGAKSTPLIGRVYVIWGSPSPGMKPISAAKAAAIRTQKTPVDRLAVTGYRV